MRRCHSPPLAQRQAPVRERLPARKASPDRAQGHLAAGLAVNKARVLRLRRAPGVLGPGPASRRLGYQCGASPGRRRQRRGGGLDPTPVRGKPRGGVSVVLVLAWDPKKTVGPSVGLQAQTSPWLAAWDEAGQRRFPLQNGVAGSHSSTPRAPRLDQAAGMGTGARRVDRVVVQHSGIGPQARSNNHSATARSSWLLDKSGSTPLVPSSLGSSQAGTVASHIHRSRYSRYSRYIVFLG